MSLAATFHLEKTPIEHRDPDRSIIITTDLTKLFDRSNRVLAGAFPSVRHIFFFFIFTKYATRTGLKIEIGNRGIYEQGFQERGISQSAEKRSDKYVYVYRVRSQQRSCQYTHENVVSKIVYLSTDFCEFDFFFPFTLTFSLSLSLSLFLTLSPSFSPFLSLPFLTPHPVI